MLKNVIKRIFGRPLHIGDANGFLIDEKSRRKIGGALRRGLERVDTTLGKQRNP